MINSGRTYGFRIFIVEDNRLYAEVIKKQLVDDHYEVHLFQNGQSCLDGLDLQPDIVTLDFSLPDLSGHEVLKQIRAKVPQAQVIIISVQESIDTAIELMKEGAYDYIVKAYDTNDKLRNIIRNIYQSYQLKQENIRLKNALKEHYNFRKLIKGNSRVMDHVFDLMRKAAQTNISVSIFGESGTGKNLAAQCIHYNSSRNSNPFVTVNISAIPEEMVESELFGHEKGAFIGAEMQKAGKFEEAEGGTLFLNEIDLLDMNIQAKLLRVIQERRVVRVDGNEAFPFDVRILSSSNRSMASLVQNGEFRQDLYYHLLGLPVEMPPLRMRGNDIILLAKYFINTFCGENGITPKNISEEAKHQLLNYQFPGNIRELKAMMELACVMANGESIKPLHLNMSTDEGVQNILANEKSLDEYNYEIVRYFLYKYNHNVRIVAEKLNIGKSTIYRMLQKKDSQ
jgi:two-component system, NtrC family, response regulator AtoC